MKEQRKIPSSKVQRASRFVRTGAKVGRNYVTHYTKKLFNPKLERSELDARNAEDIYDELKAKLVAKTATLIAGNPHDRDTFIGPMISEKEAARLDGWIQAAAAAGGTILCGGNREGAMLEATLMENVPTDQDLCVEEAFGPAAVLQKFSTWDEAISMVNDSKFGLQAGIFTRDFYKVQQAWDEMDVGGVVVGDVPSYRVDNMPYGGVKDSGLGREGILFAMEDMTEVRNLVIRTPPD